MPRCYAGDHRRADPRAAPPRPDTPCLRSPTPARQSAGILMPATTEVRYRMKLHRAVLCATAFCFATMLGTPARADKLKLGNEGIYPPFSIVDSDGKLKGIEPDWAREMCKRMNAECEFVVMDFKALIPSLLQSKFDALTSQ